MSATVATIAPRRARLPWVLPPLLLVGGLFFYPLALIFGQSLIGDDVEEQFAALEKHDEIERLLADIKKEKA